VLLSGVTGSGKSTTIASMLDYVNQRRPVHIVTIEDPIEYIFTDKKATINQREIGVDVLDFNIALKALVRENPDVVLIGEMRDKITFEAALNAAETGHLVFSTLHTVNASQSVERIVDMYPAGQQNQIRSMLANTLQAVISQTLFSRIDSPGMVPAVEVMLCTPGVRNIIREARTFEIPNVIDTNRQLGMVALDASIAEIYFNGLISREDAIAQAAYPDKLERQLAA